ncbi:MAG: hypothetical protein H0U66_03140 [Gemmatimonadaceae bacterium]|nr:hypothetical protein [Gemmatimonadaceae bacterium]
MISVSEQRALWKLVREYAYSGELLAEAVLKRKLPRDYEKKRFTDARSALSSFIEKLTAKAKA